MSFHVFVGINPSGLRPLCVAACALISAFALSGCTPFQPPPPDFSKWYKTGVSLDGVKSAMRACGYTNLDGAGDASPVDIRLTRFYCMKDAGFKRNDNLDLCKTGRISESPVCEGRR
ncbi:hypothetical protein [Pseudomonas antarctica]|uniref:hypothetical protein n=1 Tax=Pseudomonas antarctica TaxID=219572 RepID=UPI00387AF99B